MKAVVVLSSLPEVLFCWGDEEFVDQLYKRGGKERPAKLEDAITDELVTYRFLPQTLLPLFAIQASFELLSLPISCWRTNEGYMCVSIKHDQFLYLAVDDELPKELLDVEIRLFRDLLQLKYGPVTTMLRSDPERTHRAIHLVQTIRWQLVAQQSVLVQSIEHVTMRIARQEFQAALETCFKDKDSPWGSHALLLVGTNLLDYHHRPEVTALHSSDIFLITLYLQDILRFKAESAGKPRKPHRRRQKRRTLAEIIPSRQESLAIPSARSFTTSMSFRRVPLELSTSAPLDAIFNSVDQVDAFASCDEGPNSDEDSGGDDTYGPPPPPKLAFAADDVERSEYANVSAEGIQSDLPDLAEDVAEAMPGESGAERPHDNPSERLGEDPSLQHAGNLAGITGDRFLERGESFHSARADLGGRSDSTSPVDTKRDPIDAEALTQSFDLPDIPGSEDAHKQESNQDDSGDADNGEVFVDSQQFVDGEPSADEPIIGIQGVGVGQGLSDDDNHASAGSEPASDRDASDEGDDEDEDDDDDGFNDGHAPNLPGWAIRERESVFLRTENNNYAPYILHVASLADDITLVVLSKGKHTGLSEAMFIAIRSLRHMSSLANTFMTADQQDHSTEKENELSFHIAVRGARELNHSAARINGDYFPTDDETSEHPVFERSTKDAYMFYEPAHKAWFISPEAHNASVASAMYAAGVDEAFPQYDPKALWIVFDENREKLQEPNLDMRFVRSDGALRNKDGHWAKLARNGKYYCAVNRCRCTCGQCNGMCGPDDGCNCVACSLLDGSMGFGNLEIMERRAKAKGARQQLTLRSNKSLKNDVTSLMLAVKKIKSLVRGRICNTLDDFVKRIQTAWKQTPKIEGWENLQQASEYMIKELRDTLGEQIIEANQEESADENEAINMMQQETKEALSGYADFLKVKMAWNVTMSFLVNFPGLVHFAFVDRHNDSFFGPTLPKEELAEFPSFKANPSDSQAHEPMTLKQRFWELHIRAIRALEAGFTSMSYAYGDFRYSYYLWFEDDNGRVELSANMANQIGEAFRSRTVVGSELHKMIARDLLRHCKGTPRCYELYTIHLRLVPHATATQQAMALTEELKSTQLGGE